MVITSNKVEIFILILIVCIRSMIRILNLELTAKLIWSDICLIYPPKMKVFIKRWWKNGWINGRIDKFFSKLLVWYTNPIKHWPKKIKMKLISLPKVAHIELLIYSFWLENVLLSFSIQGHISTERILNNYSFWKDSSEKSVQIYYTFYGSVIHVSNNEQIQFWSIYCQCHSTLSACFLYNNKCFK